MDAVTGRPLTRWSDTDAVIWTDRRAVPVYLADEAAATWRANRDLPPNRRAGPRLDQLTALGVFGDPDATTTQSDAAPIEPAARWTIQEADVGWVVSHEVTGVPVSVAVDETGARASAQALVAADAQRRWSEVWSALTVLEWSGRTLLVGSALVRDALARAELERMGTRPGGSVAAITPLSTQVVQDDGGPRWEGPSTTAPNDEARPVDAPRTRCQLARAGGDAGTAGPDLGALRAARSRQPGPPRRPPPVVGHGPPVGLGTTGRLGARHRASSGPRPAAGTGGCSMTAAPPDRTGEVRRLIAGWQTANEELCTHPSFGDAERIDAEGRAVFTATAQARLDHASSPTPPTPDQLAAVWGDPLWRHDFLWLDEPIQDRPLPTVPVDHGVPFVQDLTAAPDAARRRLRSMTQRLRAEGDMTEHFASVFAHTVVPRLNTGLVATTDADDDFVSTLVTAGARMAEAAPQLLASSWRFVHDVAGDHPAGGRRGRAATGRLLPAGPARHRVLLARDPRSALARRGHAAARGESSEAVRAHAHPPVVRP